MSTKVGMIFSQVLKIQDSLESLEQEKKQEKQEKNCRAITWKVLSLGKRQVMHFLIPQVFRIREGKNM